MNKRTKNIYHRNQDLRKLMFTSLNHSAEVIITGGIVILDNATISGCEINGLELNMTFTEEGHKQSKKKLFHQFFYKRNMEIYSVNFMQFLTRTCWINIKEPTKLRFDIKGMSMGRIELKYYIIRM